MLLSPTADNGHTLANGARRVKTKPNPVSEVQESTELTYVFPVFVFLDVCAITSPA